MMKLFGNDPLINKLNFRENIKSQKKIINLIYIGYFKMESFLDIAKDIRDLLRVRKKILA